MSSRRKKRGTCMLQSLEDIRKDKAVYAFTDAIL